MAAAVRSASTMEAASASMESAASTMESTAAAMKSTSAVERITTVKAAAEPVTSVKALPAAEALTAVPSAFATEAVPTATIPPTVVVAVPAASTVSAPAAVVSATVESMEPRAGAQKHAAAKIVRPVVTIWGACVRIIAIVSVCAVRRGTIRRSRPDAELNCNLRVCI